MTAQISEQLLYLGEKHSLCDEPLAMYFELGGNKPDFESPSSALWRGYIGSWEIVGDRLYIVGLVGHLKGGIKANLATVFPNYPDRVFAHWFSGKVRLPQGKQLKYVHMGYGSVYERDIFLHFENGILAKSEVVENGKAINPRAPDGYGVGAWTKFSSKDTKKDGGEL